MKNMKKLMSMAMALLAVGVMSLTGCTKNEAAPVSYTHLRAHETPEHLVQFMWS